MTEGLVRALRALYITGKYSTAVLAEWFSIDQRYTRTILFEDGWDHVEGTTKPHKTRRRLTLEDEATIRDLYTKGNMYQRELAKKYSVGQTVIGRICHGADIAAIKALRHRITSTDEAIIRSRYSKGDITQRELASEYGVSRGWIGRICIYIRHRQ